MKVTLELKPTEGSGTWLRQKTLQEVGTGRGRQPAGSGGSAEAGHVGWPRGGC